MSNTPNRSTITVRRVIATRAFRQGVEDYQRGLPPRDRSRLSIPRRAHPKNIEWSYERGRQLAAYCEGRGIEVPALKGANRRVTLEAITRMTEGTLDGGIL